MSKKKSKPVPPPSIGSTGIIIQDDDLNINKGEIHKDMIDSVSINQGAHKNKKAYTRKVKHKKPK